MTNFTKAFIIINYWRHIWRVYSCNIIWTAEADQGGLLNSSFLNQVFVFFFVFNETGVCSAGYSHKHPHCPHDSGVTAEASWTRSTRRRTGADLVRSTKGEAVCPHSSGRSHRDALDHVAVGGLRVCRDRWAFKRGERYGQVKRRHLALGDRWRLSLGKAGGIIVAKWVISTAHRCDHAVPELEVVERRKKWMANIKCSYSKQKSTNFSRLLGHFKVSHPIIPKPVQLFLFFFGSVCL